MRRDRKLPSQTPVLFARRLARLSAAFLTAGMCLSWPALSAQAQEAAIIQPGATAVTGFSGTIVPRPDRDLPPGADPLDETFIDTAGATLRIFDLSRLGGPATGQLVATPPPFEVTAGQIGQVFSLTYDDGVRDGEPDLVPNLYAGATSLHGIRIVTPDADGDGRPERQRRGMPGATFMEGQFGAENGGGPGTIWKIDGRSGAISKFADIESNSGPGIGDIAFDPDHRQFFASDLDSGLIHRIDAEGSQIDAFDHGADGRPLHSMPPIEDDGSVMDIQGSAFNSEDPATWGFTQEQRRVWALAYHQGRLYYSVGDRAEIWSIGIADDGSFAGDARRELIVDSGENYAVSDIVFDGDGRLYLAQRGPIRNGYDYGQFALSGKARILRYARANRDDPATEGMWVETPDEYAVGFADGYRQSAGGIDLQYGYDPNGAIELGLCSATLASTGDRLRDSPALAERLKAGGPAAVDGVQLTPLPLVRPQNEPPFGSWFVSFDSAFETRATPGHVGDVEVWRPCETTPDDEALEELLPVYPPNPSFATELPVCPEGRRDGTCRGREPDLEITKRADVRRCTTEGGCAFIITVTNVGEAPYHGEVVLNEVTLPAGSILDLGPNPPWTCSPATSPIRCTHPVTTLAPGGSLDLRLGFMPAAGWQGSHFANCARFDYKASRKPIFGRTDNDRACARIPVCKKGDNRRLCNTPDGGKVDLILQKRARPAVCTADGRCTFVIDIINNGTDTYSGPLAVTDGYPLGAPASIIPSPSWSCAPDGSGRFRCENPGVVLVPGASTALRVTATMPAGYDREKVTNCAELRAIPGETMTVNNSACASARLPRKNPGQPALRITKTCDPAAANAPTVSCRITVSNLGSAQPLGPVRVVDVAKAIGSSAPVQINAVLPDGPEWACDEVPATELACRIPGDAMAPGATRHFDVTLTGQGRFENCARGFHGPAPGDDIVHRIGQACAKGGAISPIRVEKTGDSECKVGQPCNFRITVTNESDSAFSAPMRFGDAIGIDGIGRLEGLAIRDLSPALGCPEAPQTLPLSCVAALELGARESRTYSMTVVLPESAAPSGSDGKASGQNCIGVVSPDTPVRGGAGAGGAGEGSNAHACHRFTVAKETKQECSKGFVMNAQGNCVCPQGSSFRNGRCVPQEPPKPTKPKKPRECVLLKGQVRTASGQCVCPRGTELVNGACMKIVQEPPVRACKLLPGQIRTRDGRCVCPRGTELRGNRCRPVRTVEVCKIRGQVHDKQGRCVCPRGTNAIRGACRPTQVEQCPPGTVLKGKRCVPVQRSCPPGMIGEYPDCFRRREPQIRIDPGLFLDVIPRDRTRPQRTPRQDRPTRIIPGTNF